MRFTASTQGSHLVELAISLPIFLAMLFGIIDLSRVAAGYAAVRSAVAVGARRGAGLDRPEWNQVSALFQGSDAQILSVGRGLTLTTSPTFTSNASDGTLSSWYESRMSQNRLSFLYRMELRAIAYANLAMRNSLGGARYPCEDDGNCFNCFTLRGDPDFQQFFSVGGLGATWTVKVVALRCSYFVPISSASIGLGILPSTIEVSSQAFIPIKNYDDSSYAPD